MATVSMNDVSAYFCGVFFGRRFIKAPFLALSPNKTWEGFIGAGICTIIFSFVFSAVLARWTWFTCPAEDLHIIPFPPPLHCVPNPVFTEVFMQQIPLTNCSISVLPIQMHGLAYGLFASIVSPFGGFFASAIKRAYKLKDFDSFMPGHGGMMDRMDCQLMMMAFTSFHYSYYISPSPTLARMEFLISTLTRDKQILLLNYVSQTNSIYV
jgi:phosphatidate cytidylyltransferase